MGQLAGFLTAAAIAGLVLFAAVQLQSGDASDARNRSAAAGPGASAAAPAVATRAPAPVLAAGGVIPAGQRQQLVIVLVRPGSLTSARPVVDVLPHLLVRTITREVDPAISIEQVHYGIRAITSGQLRFRIVDLRYE